MAGSEQKSVSATACKTPAAISRAYEKVCDLLARCTMLCFAAAAAGMLGGLSIAGLHAVLEHGWFHMLNKLGSMGVVKRLAPSIPLRTMSTYKMQSFWAVALPAMPLAALIFLGRYRYLERCQFSWDVFGGWLFTWTVMVLHDAYFMLVHSLLHKSKLAYRRIHQWHHASSGDLTAFSTAYGDILDIACTITGFYSLLMLWLYNTARWNPLHIFFLAWAMNNVDIMGHCGYCLPLWLYAPASLGILLTPFAQRPKHHYIHHLDPRYNRSLYFTWWDRLAGTYQEQHPKVEND